jgi:ABC-type multidrug transport system fused ATPase/permease subunit
MTMKEEFETEKMLIEYYQAQKEAFLAKMKTEDDERSNLKFKVAAMVIYELTHCLPPWFQNHFLMSLAMNNPPDFIDENIIKVEQAFYDTVADYLFKLESDVDYVKKNLATARDEQQKKEFWQAIVTDAFLIVGIYFCPTLQSRIYEKSKMKQTQNANTAVNGNLFSMLMAGTRPCFAAAL